MSNGVNVCARRGLYSAALLPHYDALQAHLETLEHAPPPAFARPPSLGPLTEGLLVLEEACESRFGSPPRARQRYAVSQRTCDHCGAAHGGRMVPERRCTIPPRDGKTAPISEEEEQWRAKVRVGYERVCQTLWRVAREFDVRGYGLVLREKLEHKWCHCGCSTDHLGEVCERTVREEEDVRARERDRAAVGGPSAKRKGKAVCDEPTPTLDRAHDFGTKGKEREWDGRGSGVYGWGTEEEEDVWELELDFAQGMPEEQHGGKDNNNGKSDYTNTNRPTSRDPDECNMTVGELMNWRYFKAEREKEVGNTAFKAGAYGVAILHYERAHAIEPEVPHYQLNIAAAHLKLSRSVSISSRAILSHVFDHH
jgi:RNA polymerase II-associated protein 3